MMDKSYETLEEKLCYHFKDRSLLVSALTHASSSAQTENNEPLEFLGDRILGLILAHHFYNCDKTELVGDMASHLAFLASREICAEIADKLDLFHYAVLSKGLSSNPKANVAVHANLCEALIAAIYLDGGLDEAMKVVKMLWHEWLDQDNTKMKMSSKNVLQELAQATGTTPSYELLSRTGPDHAPEFIVKVNANHLGEAQGLGSSRQAAEKDAAQKLLDRLDK